jgi:hypothetical protein
MSCNPVSSLTCHHAPVTTGHRRLTCRLPLRIGLSARTGPRVRSRAHLSRGRPPMPDPTATALAAIGDRDPHRTVPVRGEAARGSLVVEDAL